MSITKTTLEMHQKDCDKCCGTGTIHDAGIYELIKRWRREIGLSAKAFAALVGVPYTSYCKFENGRVVFSEARIRILIQMLTLAEGKRQKELRGETIPDDRQPAICPHCQTRWTYRDGKWNAVIKRHGRHCQCPDNWKCTICKALILNPADFAEYEKNGTHVACMEKELTGTEHFPPCEEWSHGWTNTETGVECSRCGVRRGNCPECGHDEHGAVCRMAKSGNGSVLQRLPSAHNAADRGRRLKANLCTKYRKVGFCAKKNTTAG